MRKLSVSDLAKEARYLQPGKESVEPHTEPELDNAMGRWISKKGKKGGE